MGSQVHVVDLAIIAIYLSGVTAFGIALSRRERRTVSGYFLADRSLGWAMIGTALFATNISTVHLVGLASNGFKDGLVYGNFEWMAPFCLVLLGLVFAPFYHSTRVATLPEFVERRFGPASRTCLAFMAVVGALFIHMGVSLYSGAVIFHILFGVPILASLLVVSAVTALYTVLGGLKAVVVTEALQTALLLVGAVVVTGYAVAALPQRGIASWHDFSHAVGAERLSMLQTGGENPWWGFVLGYPVLGVWYWCADQTIVQRVLGARTQRDAQLGPLLCGYLKVLPVFLMVFPGVIAYVLFRDRIGSTPDATLTVLIDELLPVGLKGLIAAGLLAALMSTVAGALNSTSTLVSIDIVGRMRPQASERTLIAVGRVTAGVVMVLAVLWSTQGERFGGIFKGLNAMIACLAPPITTVFLGGVFWRRGTAAAALATLLVGFVLGAIVFVLDFEVFGLQIITRQLGIPFMMQAWWLFVACSAVFMVVSWMTPPPRADQLENLCWGSPLAAVRSAPWQGLADPRFVALLLAAAMATLYWTFA